MGETILDVRNLTKRFPLRRGLLGALAGRDRWLPAVDGVSFYLKEGETLGLVGESGCGKTTVGRAVLGLIPATSGTVSIEGTEITALSAAALRPLRRRMQMIFQDPDAALDPRMRVREILKEAVTAHRSASDADADRRISELLDQVSLDRGKLASFPDELSGGEKRRVGIARALAVGPRLIVADEPTGALDVSIQAQVVNLLVDLQGRLGLSYLFISHDLRIVELVSRKVAVMYLGKIVETGLAEAVARAPRHPYTRLLWSSQVDARGAPQAGAPSGTARIAVPRDLERPSGGCPFAPRCPLRAALGNPPICTDPATAPGLTDIGGGHRVACHFAHEGR